MSQIPLVVCLTNLSKPGLAGAFRSRKPVYLLFKLLLQSNSTRLVFPTYYVSSLLEGL